MGRVKSEEHREWQKILGKRLRDIRIARGLTYTEVTNQTQIPRGPLTEIEKGTREPSLWLMLRLCRCYCVSVDEMIG
jgi:DNA-binding XRE family transcriptional regulator